MSFSSTDEKLSCCISIVLLRSKGWSCLGLFLGLVSPLTSSKSYFYGLPHFL
ncbi:hypothetical protein Hanom_Chr08g00734001 [Helianthus anomalus]